MQSPDLSVVVIGRNEASRLTRCFDAVKAMRLPGISMDLIYADSQSTDDSCRVAEQAGAKVIALRSDRPTAALGREVGWRAARAPFVLFIDGDSAIDPDFVRLALPEFDDANVAVAFGRTCELDPSASLFSRVYHLEWPGPPPGPWEFCLGTALMRRRALEDVQGHDTSLMAGEEVELCYRMRRRGYVIQCLDRPMAFHDIAMTSFAQYWRRNMRRGYGDAEVCERFGRGDSPAYQSRTRRTRIWGPILTLSLLIAAGTALATASWISIAIWVAAFAALGLTTFWKRRSAAASASTLLLYGIHSYLKEFPLLCGQFRYYLDKYTGGKTRIEYKPVPDS